MDAKTTLITDDRDTAAIFSAVFHTNYSANITPHFLYDILDDLLVYAELALIDISIDDIKFSNIRSYTLQRAKTD